MIGADEANDVALLKVDNASGLPAAELGRSADVKVGEDVVAIGNALGLRGRPDRDPGHRLRPQPHRREPDRHDPDRRRHQPRQLAAGRW